MLDAVVREYPMFWTAATTEVRQTDSVTHCRILGAAVGLTTAEILPGFVSRLVPNRIAVVDVYDEVC